MPGEMELLLKQKALEKQKLTIKKSSKTDAQTSAGLAPGYQQIVGTITATIAISDP